MSLHSEAKHSPGLEVLHGHHISKKAPKTTSFKHYMLTENKHASLLDFLSIWIACFMQDLFGVSSNSI